MSTSLESTGPALHSAAAEVRVSGLTRAFKGSNRPAVSDVSFEVGAGELLALVGASGSGKTTTLRIIAGFEAPDAGEVRLTLGNGDARNITNEPPQRRGFGMVFQHYALFPHMSVVENVAFGLEARGVSKSDRLTRARAALDHVGLGAATTRAVQSLSGGEQQRVALARALVIEPPVLLLDEPLSNLDPALRQGTRDQLRAMLRGLRLTAIFVTHDQEDAFAIADRVAMLQRGELLQVGTPEALYDHPATVDVARFIGHASLLPATRDESGVALRVGDIVQRVPLAHGPAPRSASSERQNEGPLLAVVRPEMFALSAPDDPNAWPGMVTTRRFAGGHFVYTVTLSAPGAPQVEVTAANGSAREHEAVGLRVTAQQVALVRP